MSQGEWADYVGQFHHARPGITEAVLGASRAAGVTPYEWFADGIAEPGRSVVDLACGSAPLQPIIASGWLGVDRSAAELRAARRKVHTAPVCRADARALPFRDCSADVVLCCMSLMVIPSVEATLRELSRVARHDAVVAVLIPGYRPLTARDRLRYGRLLLALRITNFRYPNPEVVSDPAQVMRRAGLTVLDDASKRFAFTFTNEATADQFVDSLYLPHTAPHRVDTAKRLTRRWLQTDLGIPLRRLIAKAGCRRVG